MKAKTCFWLLMVLVLGVVLATSRPGLASPTPPPAQAALLVTNSVEQLLAGDLLHTTTVDEVQAHLAAYPADWPVVGVGTTDWIGRNGELMPDGTASDLRFWWADPATPLAEDKQTTSGSVYDLLSPPSPPHPHTPRFPFLALAIGDPSTAIAWSLQDVENVHTWLEEKLEAEDIDLAGVQLHGQFGPVKTTVAYNIPLTGLDLSGGYVGEDVFRFGEYITAMWTMNGLYAAAPALQPLISTAGHPLHLHGYQPDTMLGGHIGSASAISVTATVWPLSGVVAATGELDSLRLLGDPSTGSGRGLVRIPGPSLDEGAVTQYMADLLAGWGISTTLNLEEPWVVGHLPGSGLKVALIAHLDEPRYLLTQVDEDGIAIFDGIYYAPTWERAELAKFLTYEEVAWAPIIHNPDSDARLALYVPEWESSLPVLSWTVRDVQHQIATVPLNKEQAMAARAALAEGQPLVAINQSGLHRATDPLVGEVVLGSPLDNRLGAAIILSLARRYAALDPADRPDLYIVGRPREEHLDPSSRLFIPPIADADLVIVVDEPAPKWYPTLGGGPVVVWNRERTPEWVVEFVPGSRGARTQGVRGEGQSLQIFEADDPAFLTGVANDAGPEVPALLVGPTMLRSHSSQEKVAVADIEGCERLLMALLSRIAGGEVEVDYRAAFRRAVQAHFSDPALFHDPHGLGTLGLLRDEIIADPSTGLRTGHSTQVRTGFGQAQYDDWLAHALAEACVIETPDGWAAQYINEPDLPALPQCSGQPGYHSTNMLLLALNWLGWDGLPQTDWDPDSPTGTRTWIIPKEEFVRWLQASIQPEPFSPGLAAQALIASGVTITQTWTTNDGQTWTVETWLDQVIEDWRAERAELDLKPGDFIPDRLMHVAPALIELLRRYPEYTSKYGPVLDEAFAYYESLLTEEGYWHFPGEAYDAGHIIEQYVRAQQAGMNIALPTLRPIELMVQHQRPDGLFDLGLTNYIGAQAHGVRALGVTLPLLEAQAAAEGTSEPVETSIALPVQAPPPHLTTLTLCLEVSEDGRCTSPQTEFQPDVTIYYVLTYENLSPSDEIVERWFLGEEEWAEAALNTDYVIKQGGASGRFASSGIRLTASEWERLGRVSTSQLELWLNGKLALTIEFTVTSPAAEIGPLVIALPDPSTDSGSALLVDIEPIYTIHVQK